MMKKISALLFIFFVSLTGYRLYAESDTLQPTCDFNMYPKASEGCNVNIYYAGNAPNTATFTWNFDGATIISGSGIGPYTVVWNSGGWKTVTLSVICSGQSCNNSKMIHIVGMPVVYSMTGGGSYPSGGSGVHVGLSGSQPNYTYYLMLNGGSSSHYAIGTGNAIDFGLITTAGTYTCQAKVDSCNCERMMDGTAVVTITGYVYNQYICMVTFDTAMQRNKVVWNKYEGEHISHFNIYRETYQNNVFAKIGEVPFSSFSIFIDTTANPLVKSDKYELTGSDSLGNESAKSPYHKTVHLNISPGILGFNLIWNPYEGFDFYTCKIHRRFTGQPWQLIDSVASNVTSYTDLYVTSGLATYYIEVIRNNPCNPALKEGGYESVVSNTATSAPLGISENSTTGIMVFPNPAHEKLVITLPSSGSSEFNLVFYSIDGRKLRDQRIGSVTNELDISGYPAGLYILKIKGDHDMLVKRIIKE
jgi:hypothetical protein